MPLVIPAHFDGRAIVPDEPLELPAGQRLVVSVEAAPPRFAALLELAADLPDAPADLAARHSEFAAGDERP